MFRLGSDRVEACKGERNISGNKKTTPQCPFTGCFKKC
jgi:hypothetical protein